MVGAEHGTDLLSGLPFWVQVAANLGMFLVAVIAAAFGFMRRVSGKLGYLAENHIEEGGQFHKTGSDISDLASAMTRLAVAAEAILALLRAQAREDDIEREVARRLREKTPVKD